MTDDQTAPPVRILRVLERGAQFTTYDGDVREDRIAFTKLRYRNPETGFKYGAAFYAHPTDAQLQKALAEAEEAGAELEFSLAFKPTAYLPFNVSILAAPEPIRYAEDDEIQRHAEKQGCSWADAWRHFEREGYDMSRASDQYE